MLVFPLPFLVFSAARSYVLLDNYSPSSYICINPTFFFLLISCLPIPNSVKKLPSYAVLWIYHLLYLYLTFSFEIDPSDPENEIELSSEMHKLCEHFITMATV